jgi:hypothetical protein
MRKFHSIAALCGDGLRPELQALFDRLDRIWTCPDKPFLGSTSANGSPEAR